MGKIQVMSEGLANKIAAGEVVERPASVVKELVENAIDAGADEIRVEVKQGGLESIRVCDNGYGMEREDVRLAFARHATSKIREDRDLFRIRTLGFRGEALPSIAAVSRVEVLTRPPGQVDGTRLRLEGGKIVAEEVAASPSGTDITVRDLFFNTPARLKYMKSVQTELGHIIDGVQRLALAYPAIAFQLQHNGHLLLNTPGDGKLLHVLAAIYGRQVAKHMLTVTWEDSDYRIHGFTSYPEITRANRQHCTLFVNGRYIRSYPLVRAVQDAYHTRLPVHRFPICVLHLEMDPTLVDVNVHPAKLEVRFSQEQDVVERVQEAIRQALAKGTFIPKAAPRREKERTFQERLPLSQRPPGEEGRDRPIRSSAGGESSSADTPASRIVVTSARQPSSPVLSPAVQEAAMQLYQPTQSRAEGGTPPREAYLSSAREEQRPQTTGAGEEKREEKEPLLPPLRAVAQVLGMYVIAQNEKGLYIIDQHAAHEKILFERYSRQMRQRQIHPLPLLIPMTLELTPAEAETLDTHLPYLAECQMEMERFGGTTFLVRTVPDLWEGLNLTALTRELIDELLQGRFADPKQAVEELVIQKSCKGAIKANQWLSLPEMQALCDQLQELENPFHCPHGRPILIEMTSYDLEKMFKRVM